MLNSVAGALESEQEFVQAKLQGTLGIDVLMDVKGGDAQVIFSFRKTELICSLKKDLHQLLYAILIQLDLPRTEARLKRFYIWNVQTWPTFIQPDYVHVLQLVTGSLKSFSQYGTHNEESKNQNNNE